MVEGIAPQAAYAIGIAQLCYHEYGATLVVTSVRDGKHGERSLHPSGLAFDCRTRNLSPHTVSGIVQDMKFHLDPLGYDVVLEHDPPHIHVEYDKKGDEDWIQTIP